MSKPLRTFIAVNISPLPKLRAILRQLTELGRGVKAVDPESLHVTLKFLGDTRAEQVPDVAHTLESIVKEVEAFTVSLVGLGAFPHWGRPAVVWTGLESADPLVEIANRLESELEPLGFPREKRAFHPHQTLARLNARPPAELQAIKEAHETESFGEETIDRVILFQSELQPGGPVYTALSTVALAHRSS